jgi:hypothetical protein
VQRSREVFVAVPKRNGTKNIKRATVQKDASFELSPLVAQQYFPIQ